MYILFFCNRAETMSFNMELFNMFKTCIETSMEAFREL